METTTVTFKENSQDILAQWARADAAHPVGEVSLRAHVPLRLAGATGDRIDCLQGIVWVTQAGDEEDHLLCPGEAFTVKRRGLVVVEALRDAAVRIG